MSTIPNPNPNPNPSASASASPSAPVNEPRKPYIFVLTGFRNTSYACSLGNQNDHQQFKTLSNAMNGGSLALLAGDYDEHTWVCYVDDAALLKPDLEQNEALAYLLGHMCGYLGVMYGTGIIEFGEPQKVKTLFEATKKWFQSYKNGDFEDDVDLAVEKSSFDETLSKIQ